MGDAPAVRKVTDRPRRKPRRKRRLANSGNPASVTSQSSSVVSSRVNSNGSVKQEIELCRSRRVRKRLSKEESLMQILEMRREARARAQASNGGGSLGMPESAARDESLVARGRQWLDRNREDFPSDVEGQVRKHFELRPHTRAVRTDSLPRFVITEVAGKEVSREHCPDPEAVVRKTLERFKREQEADEAHLKETAQERQRNPFWRHMNRSSARAKRQGRLRKLREEAEAGVIALMDERQRSVE